MKLYPDYYFNNVNEITIEFLIENNIQGLVLDVDNTLIDYYKVMPVGTKEWAEHIKEKGIKVCIVSNSNNKKKVEEVAKTIGVEYIFFANKPLKRSFKKAKEILGLNNENIAVIGDQIFTDVWGANRSGMISILVEPIYKRDLIITVIKRPIERAILKKINKTNEGKKE